MWANGSRAQGQGNQAVGLGLWKGTRVRVLGYLRVQGTCIYPLGSQRPRDKNNAVDQLLQLKYTRNQPTNQKKKKKKKVVYTKYLNYRAFTAISSPFFLHCQSCNFRTVQSCNFHTIQSYNFCTIQSCNFYTVNLAIFAPFNPAIFAPFNLAIFVPSILQFLHRLSHLLALSILCCLPAFFSFYIIISVLYYFDQGLNTLPSSPLSNKNSLPNFITYYQLAFEYIVTIYIQVEEAPDLL